MNDRGLRSTYCDLSHVFLSLLVFFFFFFIRYKTCIILINNKGTREGWEVLPSKYRFWSKTYTPLYKNYIQGNPQPSQTIYRFWSKSCIRIFDLSFWDFISKWKNRVYYQISLEGKDHLISQKTKQLFMLFTGTSRIWFIYGFLVGDIYLNWIFLYILFLYGEICTLMELYSQVETILSWSSQSSGLAIEVCTYKPIASPREESNTLLCFVSIIFPLDPTRIYIV